MDCPNYITEAPERKRGQHLRLEDRGTIHTLKAQGFFKKIPQAINCSPTIVSNELKRGTAQRKNSRGRALRYSPKPRSSFLYDTNRNRCHKPHKLASCGKFFRWVLTELPGALKYKAPKEKNKRENKRVYGTSINLRPAIAGQHIEEGH